MGFFRSTRTSARNQNIHYAALFFLIWNLNPTQNNEHQMFPQHKHTKLQRVLIKKNIAVCDSEIV